MTREPESILTHLGATPARPGGSTPGPATRVPTLCGDLDMRIDREGVWHYQGSPIGRKPLVRLFSTVLRREADGFWLVTPAERGRIVVEDAPFIAVAVDAQGTARSQRLRFRTNVDDEIVADKAHPIRVVHDPVTEEPRPYVLVRDGLEARIARSVYYELVGLGGCECVDGHSHFGVWSAGTFFPLGRAEGPC
ncbi:MAG: DUF1285 domain-containing protein [Alphaproteobacteria bacterium]|nr:DUF1285 domain-containing protein [Alphaproteobacteria bacterium]